MKFKARWLVCVTIAALFDLGILTWLITGSTFLYTPTEASVLVAVRIVQLIVAVVLTMVACYAYDEDLHITREDKR